MSAPRGFSRHHALWIRCDYKKGHEKTLRNHEGLVPVIPNELHFQGFPDSVHSLLDAPPKPRIAKTIGALALLDRQPDNYAGNPAYVINMLAHYFGANGEEAVGNHLLRQLEIYGEDILL